MDKLYEELTAEEIIVISGGNAYKIGYAIGAWWANFVDEWHGVLDGLINN
jgi:hypothetical protein